LRIVVVRMRRTEPRRLECLSWKTLLSHSLHSRQHVGSAIQVTLTLQAPMLLVRARVRLGGNV
jgi:hypothetical protein